MPQLFPIATITDEFSQDIEAAVHSMAEIGMTGAELRMVFGKNIIDLSDTELDRASGVQTVRVKRIGLDDQPFKIELDPGNPAADDKGFVKLPNVNLLVELADMREANRSYEANLQVVKQSGDLTSMTIGLLKD